MFASAWEDLICLEDLYIVEYTDVIGDQRRSHCLSSLEKAGLVKDGRLTCPPNKVPEAYSHASSLSAEGGHGISQTINLCDVTDAAGSTKTGTELEYLCMKAFVHGFSPCGVTVLGGIAGGGAYLMVTRLISDNKQVDIYATLRSPPTLKSIKYALTNMAATDIVRYFLADRTVEDRPSKIIINSNPPEPRVIFWRR